MNLLSFLFEIGHLRKIKHEGWRYAGIEHPESVADHSLRAAQIGFILGCLENYKNPTEICTMVVWHDIGECRVGDIHKIGLNYNNPDEQKAVQDQTKNIGPIGQQIFDLWKKVEHRSSQAGHLSKDADLLEQALTAREYMANGHELAVDWIDYIARKLRTNSAKKLLHKLKKSDPNEWWRKLKKN